MKENNNMQTKRATYNDLADKVNKYEKENKDLDNRIIKIIKNLLPKAIKSFPSTYKIKPSEDVKEIKSNYEKTEDILKRFKDIKLEREQFRKFIDKLKAGIDSEEIQKSVQFIKVFGDSRNIDFIVSYEEKIIDATKRLAEETANILWIESAFESIINYELKTILDMKYLGEIEWKYVSYEEIAKKLNIGVGTARRREEDLIDMLSSRLFRNNVEGSK